MRRMPFTVLSLALLVTTFSVDVHAQSSKSETERLADQLATKKQKYYDAAKTAKTKLLASFDGVSRNAGQGLPKGQRADLQKAILQAKANFQQNDTLPTEDAMVHALFQYQVQLQGARKPVIESFDKLIKLHQKIGDAAAEKKVMDERAAFNAESSSIASFVNNSTWSGIRENIRGVTQFRLSVSEVKDNEFNGVVVQDNGWAKWEITGISDGSHIQLKATKLIQGNKLYFSAQGYVIGERMLLEVSNLNKKGHLEAGIVVLNLAANRGQRAK